LTLPPDKERVGDIGNLIDNAMEAIEQANIKPS
jgi:sensor histidine kinase regulating citrate/malate metabolism